MNDDLPTPEAPRHLFDVRTGLTTEEALTNASEMLGSAIALAHESAFDLNEAQCTKVLGIINLVEIAHLLVNQALDHVSPTHSE